MDTFDTPTLPPLMSIPNQLKFVPETGSLLIKLKEKSKLYLCFAINIFL